nr:hypothetical protein [Streptomyces sp. 2231.1]
MAFTELLQRVVGWSIADHMRTSLVTDGIEMAVAARGGRVHGVVSTPTRAPNTAGLFQPVWFGGELV